VLEVGCGREGGLVDALAARGYEVLGVDPAAPEGGRSSERRSRTHATPCPEEAWDAVVAGRVLHHVNPLDEGLDLLASLAPLLLVDEFAWDRIDAAAQDWYERQHSLLHAAGAEPYGPRDLDEWPLRLRDYTRTPSCSKGYAPVTRNASLEWVPYFHHWLNGPASEALEQTLVDAGAIPAIGYRWAGASSSTTRSSARSR
jgi:hypothetical protein